MSSDPDFDWPAKTAKESASESSRAASSALVWGVLAMFGWLLPPVGVLFAIAGLVRGYQGRYAPNRDRARVGVVLSVIALLMAGWLTAWIWVVSTSFPEDY